MCLSIMEIIYNVSFKCLVAAKGLLNYFIIFFCPKFKINLKLFFLKTVGTNDFYHADKCIHLIAQKLDFPVKYIYIYI